jgi:uncharacterized membrane-anchored protein YjiN (DUF445 family)
MNSKYLAGLSLAVMASGFVVTLFLPDNPLVFLLKGGFEAGLVGGVADWFAVTALFRHPLGIPIPHTSLLLKNRDKIVQSLISAMENELLNKQSIEDKLRKLNVIRLASSFLTKLLGRKKVRVGLLDLLEQLLLRLPLEQTVPFIQSGIRSYISKADLKTAADSALTKVMEDGYDIKAFDYALREAAQWAERPETRIMLGQLANEKLSEVKVGGLMGFAFQAFAGFMNEEKLGPILQNMLLSAIRDLMDKDNDYRDTIIREIRIRLFQLAGSESDLDRLKGWIDGRVAGQDGSEFLLKRLEEVRGLLLGKLAEERLRGGRIIFKLYRTAVRHLNKEPGWIDVWETRLLAYLLGLVEANHYRIGRLVKENLDRMDNASLVSMLEEKIGQDLQWIRVNGALCGFVIGIVLSLIQLL